MQAIKTIYDILRPKHREANKAFFCLWLLNPLTYSPHNKLKIIYANLEVYIERDPDEPDVDYVMRAEARAKELYNMTVIKDSFAVIGSGF